MAAVSWKDSEVKIMMRTTYLAVLTICLAAHGATARDHRPLASEYADMTPRMVPENWHLHDPSAIVALDGWQVVVVTGKENTGGYRCGLESWRRRDASARWQPH